MNEIVAILFLALNDFYFNFERVRQLDEQGHVTEEDIEEVYKFLHDRSFLMADLFTLLDSIMKKGLSELYCAKNDDPNHNSDSADSEISKKQKDLFNHKFNDEKSMKTGLILKEKVVIKKQ